MTVVDYVKSHDLVSGIKVFLLHEMHPSAKSESRPHPCCVNNKQTNRRTKLISITTTRQQLHRYKNIVTVRDGERERERVSE